MSYHKNVQEYQQNQIPNEGNPRHNEAWALIEVARRMAAVIQYGDLSTKQDKDKLREVFRLNLRIWTIIQAEQSVGENVLPDPIRVNILNLCRFIDRHTMESLSQPTAERAIVLVDINRNIAHGLLGNPSDEEEGEIAPTDEVSAPGDEPASADELAPTEIQV